MATRSDRNASKLRPSKRPSRPARDRRHAPAKAAQQIPAPSAGPAASPIAPVRPDLADQARAHLEEMIVSLELAPGSVWSEGQLSALIGIGRTPVREALQQLEGEHLVRILPRHGAQITDINPIEQLLMLELRRDLDRLIAAGAARRSTAPERARLLEMANRLEVLAETGEGVLDFLRHHYEIKTLLAQCARNPFLARAALPCYAISRRFYYLHHQAEPDLAVAARKHAVVVRAVAAGDAAKAATASDALMDYIEAFTRRTVMPRV
jgi:DNA-binding GntR family transcriptional regulator